MDTGTSQDFCLLGSVTVSGYKTGETGRVCGYLRGRKLGGTGQGERLPAFPPVCVASLEMMQAGRLGELIAGFLCCRSCELGALGAPIGWGPYWPPRGQAVFWQPSCLFRPPAPHSCPASPLCHLLLLMLSLQSFSPLPAGAGAVASHRCSTCCPWSSFLN